MSTRSAPQARLEIVNQRRKGRLEELPLRHDDHVERFLRAMRPEHLAHAPLRQIPLHGAAKLPGGGDAEPADIALVGESEEREIPPVHLRTAVVHVLELRATSDAMARREALIHGHLRRRARRLRNTRASTESDYETARRFRPFARRRFNTRRPFFVLIRTRNPWVRRRLRRFG
jgi:hypothetical protein